VLLTIFYRGDLVQKMEIGGKKVLKTDKTKFRKNRDKENYNFNKQKHHDKSYYRVLREELQEEKVYVV